MLLAFYVHIVHRYQQRTKHGIMQSTTNVGKEQGKKTIQHAFKEIIDDKHTIKVTFE